MFINEKAATVAHTETASNTFQSVDKFTKNTADKQVVQVKPGTDFNLSAPARLLHVKTFNQWVEEARQKPTPNQLFGEFWFQGETCLLFADTGVGKSILAIQMGDYISRGQSMVQDLPCEAPPQKVLCLDFELSAKQNELRYSNRAADGKTCINHYRFSDNLFRVELNPDTAVPEGFKDFDEFLIHSMEQEIEATGARVVIVDNITYLKSETEKAKDALPLMKRLNEIKKKYDLSMLVLAHTPKRDKSRPITVNDIAGSKMLSNFVDSIFAIGESSTDKGIRYLKQLKQRNTENRFDADNVLQFNPVKPTNFLHFEFIGYGKESDHLRIVAESESSELEEQVKTLMEKEPSLSSYGIAQQLCTDVTKFNSFRVKVNRIVKKIKG